MDYSELIQVGQKCDVFGCRFWNGSVGDVGHGANIEIAFVEVGIEDQSLDAMLLPSCDQGESYTARMASHDGKRPSKPSVFSITAYRSGDSQGSLRHREWLEHRGIMPTTN